MEKTKERIEEPLQEIEKRLVSQIHQNIKSREGASLILALRGMALEIVSTIPDNQQKDNDTIESSL